MQSLFKLETLKLIGGISIVLTAVCIMLPGVMGYAFGLARLAILILVVVLVSSALAFLFQILVKRKKTEDKVEKTSETS